MTLATPLANFYNDLCDVARLFFGDALLLGSADELSIRHEAEGWRDCFLLFKNGEEIARHVSEAEPFQGDALEVTRMRKRACKNALYALLKAYTRKRLPWGSLTGIRPTRLYAEAYARCADEGRAAFELVKTFDVLPEKAELLRDIARAQASVPAARPGEADVYVGIPFCPTRCSYCSFAAEAVGRCAHLVEPYLAALEREILLGAEDLRAAGMRARAVYVGGGTPTTLSPRQLASLIALLRREFSHASEWTVEAGRPDTVDAERLEALADGGIKRISVNPQTMNDATLRAIGREHTAGNVERAMELVSRYPFGVVNMDLIAALPGEDVEDMRETLARVLSMGASNITVHTLAIKRTSRLRMEGKAQLPPEESARAMVDLAAETLDAAGFAPYYLYRQKYMAGNLENVGYARENAACLYNIDNMEEVAPILAFGAGAITKWLYPLKRRIERAPNVRNIEHYVSRVEEMAERKRALIFAK